MDAKTWNELYPEGTLVRYWPIAGDDNWEATATRSEAWELGDGTPVVKIEGRTGGVSLDHLAIRLDQIVSLKDALLAVRGKVTELQDELKRLRSALGRPDPDHLNIMCEITSANGGLRNAVQVSELALKWGHGGPTGMLNLAIQQLATAMAVEYLNPRTTP